MPLGMYRGTLTNLQGIHMNLKSTGTAAVFNTLITGSKQVIN